MANVIGGDDVTPHFTTQAINDRTFAVINPKVAPSSPVLGSLSNMTPEKAQARIIEIQNKARQLLVDQTGDDRYYDTIRIPYSKLPSDIGDDFTREIEMLRGMHGPEGMLENFGVRLFKGFDDAVATKSGAFGRIQVDLLGKIQRGERITANDLWYNVTSITHRMMDVERYPDGTPKASYATAYKVAQTHYSEEYLQSMADLINDSGGDFLGDHVVLDIESPGLDPSEGMTEMAARRFSRGEQLDAVTYKMPNSAMRTGITGFGGKTRTLEEFVLDTVESPERGEYEGALDVLRLIKKANFNVVAYNAEFDIDFFMRSLKNMGEYNSDAEFRGLIDAWEDAMALNPAKAIDAKLLAATAFSDIGIAPEIAKGGTFTPISVSNLLAETDFLEYAHTRGIIEERAITELLARRTHTAEVDTALEGPIVEYLWDVISGNYKPKYRTQQNVDDGMTTVVRSAWRNRVFGDATGPRISTSDPSHIVAELWAHPGTAKLLRTPGGGVRPVTPQQQAALLTRLQGVGYGPAPTVDSNVAQSVVKYRDLVSRIFNDASTLRRGGRFGPPRTWGQWLGLQKQLSDANVPFAHLHYLERQATSVLGRATGHYANAEGMSRHLAFASALGDYMPQGMGYTSGVSVFRSGNVALPIDLVEQALGRNLTHLDVSIFPVPPNDERGIPRGMLDVAFNLGLNDEDVFTLEQYFGAEAVEGIDAETASKIIAGIKKQRKVQIASAGQGTGDIGAHRLAVHLRNLMGESITDVSSGQKNPFSVILADKASRISMAVTDLRGKASSLLGFGQVVSSIVTEDPEMLSREVAAATAAQNTANEILAASPDILHHMGRITSQQFIDDDERAMGGQVFTGAAEAAEDKLRSSLTDQEIHAKALLNNAKIKKFGGIGLGVAAVGLTGYYFYQRAKREAKLNETMAVQEYEDTYSNAFRPVAPDYDAGSLILPDQAKTAINVVATNSESRRYEYMRTAGVVRREDRNRIGHTRMGNNRNSHLFGG